MANDSTATPVPPAGDDDVNQRLSVFRKNIDEIDLRLVELLNERAKNVVEIGNNYFGGVNTLNGGGGNNVLADLGYNFFSDATTIKSFKLV